MVITGDPVQTCSLETTPLVLTSSGRHQNTYGWQADGTHPTGTLSCCKVKLIVSLPLLVLEPL